MVTVFVLTPSKVAEPVQEGGQLVPETDPRGLASQTGQRGPWRTPGLQVRNSPALCPHIPDPPVLNIWGSR